MHFKKLVSRLLPQKTALTRVFFISALTSAVKIRLNKNLIMHDEHIHY